MLPSFRILACAALAALAVVRVASAADIDSDVLPPEPTNGEWLEDTLDNGNLWFASSENLGFEGVSPALTDYPRGRRWVRVVDGRPAWVMYYVPGEILGFEIDTHHFGAAATEFRFAAGATWNALSTVDVDFEEIAAFEAKWLRLYRSASQLPGGTCFLKIEFPPDAGMDAARLTEVWLRCRFDETTASKTDDDASMTSAVTASAPATPPAAVDEFAIEPFVVRTFIYQPPTPTEPVFAPVTFAAVRPDLTLKLPLWPDTYDLIGDFVPVVEAPPPAPLKPKSLFSRIVDFVRHRVGR